MGTKVIVILGTVAASLLLGVLSDWLYDLLTAKRILPKKPSLKRSLVVVVILLPLAFMLTWLTISPVHDEETVCGIPVGRIDIDTPVVQKGQSVSVSVAIKDQNRLAFVFDWSALYGKVIPGLRSPSSRATYTAPLDAVDDKIIVQVRAPGCTAVVRSLDVSVVNVDSASRSEHPPQPHGISAPLVDLVLLVDISASMQGRPVEDVKQSSELLAELLVHNRNNRVGIVAFGTDGRLLTPLTNNMEALRSSIGEMYVGGGTDIQKGLETAYTELARHSRPEAKQIVVILSDGEADFSDALPLAEHIKGRGIDMYVVWTGISAQDNKAPYPIASGPDYIYYAADTSNLLAVFFRIVEGE